MAVKCSRVDCKFRDERGYCTLDHIEIDENGVCLDYEPDERKRIVDHNTRVAELIERVGQMEELSEEQKNKYTWLLILSMMTEDGETVAEKIMSAIEDEE